MSTHESAPRTIHLDEIDRSLLDLLRRSARTPISELARAVNLSPAPVSRRIERLERHGVIRGYVTVIDDPIGGANIATSYTPGRSVVGTAMPVSYFPAVPEPSLPMSCQFASALS